MLGIESLEYTDFSQYSSEMVQIRPLLVYRRGFYLHQFKCARFRII